MSIESHSEHTEFKMQFRIEQQPDGTFVGISDQPHLEIKGATREEVLKKIQDSLGSQIMQKLGRDLSATLGGSGVQVKVNKHISITRKNADGTVEMMSPTPDAEISGTTPITSAPIDGGASRGTVLLRWLAAIIVLVLLLYWYTHR